MPARVLSGVFFLPGELGRAPGGVVVRVWLAPHTTAHGPPPLSQALITHELGFVLIVHADGEEVVCLRC